MHIRTVILDWCKYGHCKTEAREIDCPCDREVNAMLIASAQFPEHNGYLAMQILWVTA